ncbi:hypothetical protein HRG_008597 [Hirsutella rhossiliensis]|uniref:Uncharacterized protein n=1 Tax=Hirsutella rhossiliensis TaxID=111463 RepID=A0A9P8MSU9_9HYPO|nr:uncharacterized protein HRG_08597 [Hirsutella rhossiliensis]KAH0960442.1 hypothetical protein HRG_08597 [Hirsutella rhossiliensis]
MQHLKKRYSDLLSSPTRQRLSNVSSVVTEASLLASNLQRHNSDRLQRIEKMSARPKRGKTVTTQAGAHLLYQRQPQRELMMLHKMIRQEKEQLLAEYRENKFQVIDRKRKRLTIKQWLDHKGKNEEFLSLETSDETSRRLLKRPDPFTIDITRTPVVRSAAEQEDADEACATARPLRNMRWPHLQPEREVPIFTSTQAAAAAAAAEAIDPALIEEAYDYDMEFERACNDEVERALRSSSPPQGPTPGSSPPMTPRQRSSPPLGSSPMIIPRQETLRRGTLPRQSPRSPSIRQPKWKVIEQMIKDFRASQASNSAQEDTENV